MRARFYLGFAVTLVLTPTACTPPIAANGGGGATSTAVSATGSQTQNSSASATQASSTAATTTGSNMATTSTGTPQMELQLYMHAFPFDTAGAVWTKSSISAVLGPNAPTKNIISAVKLQNFDVLYLLTSDASGQMMHYLHAGAWNVKPIDTMFPVPSTAKQDTTTPCNPTNPMGPPAVAVSTDPVFYIFHLPSLAGTCGATANGEQVTMLGKTYGTVFEISPADFGGNPYDVQRPYHTDCYMDAYGPNEYALWGFDWVNPAQCGAAPFYQTFAWYSNHVLRSTGQSATGPWTATDPNNPIFKTPPPANQPDPDSVVGAYFTQDANPATGTAVFIAP